MPTNFGLKQVTYEHTGGRFRPVCTLAGNSSHVPVWRPYGNSTDETVSTSPDFTPSGGAGTGEFFICPFDLTGITMKQSNLTGTAPEFENCTYLSDCEELFFKNSNLTTLQANMFQNTAVSTLEHAFNETGITALPSGIFTGLTSLTTVQELTHPTGNRGKFLTSLTSIPDDLFDGCSSLTTVYRAFRQCTSITTAPGENFFRGCTSLTTTEGCFDNCTAMVQQPPNRMFRDCSSLTTTKGMFVDSGVTGKIRGFIFEGCPNLTSVQAMFTECAVNEIDDTVFDQTPSIDNVSGFLNSCSLLEIPRNLFKDKSTITNIGYAVAGNPFSSIDAFAFRGLTNVVNMGALFSECPNLTTVPSDLFTDLTAVNQMGSLFTNSGLQTIPAGLFDNQTGIHFRSQSGIRYLFRDSDITSIPSDLFDNVISGFFARQPEDDGLGGIDYNTFQFHEIFRECTSLTAIPSDLFDELPYRGDGGSFTTSSSASIGGGNISWNTGVYTPANTPAYYNYYTFELYEGGSANLGDPNFLVPTSISDVQYENAGTYAATYDNVAYPGSTFSYRTLHFSRAPVEFGATFEGCTGITGAVPDLWNKYDYSYEWAGLATFEGCTNASNYASIPTDWKQIS